jgi:dTDP-4-dehydrorhamnose 3,5-epimerase
MGEGCLIAAFPRVYGCDQNREVRRIVDIVRFEIDGPLLLTPVRHEDDRGFVSETFSAHRLEEHTGPLCIVQDNHTLSRTAGTLRGLHFQVPPMAQAKLVSVV